MEQINIVNKNVFLSMIYAHTTRKTDLLYKIFHINFVFKHVWHQYTGLPVIVPMNKQTATHTFMLIYAAPLYYSTSLKWQM